MQGGNDIDYPGVISTLLPTQQMRRSQAPGGRRGENQKMRLFNNNAINSTYCMEYHLKPSRTQVEEMHNPYLG
ncbi:hypothetical protein BMS3Abin13_00279 [bacterium BMS3Abin13]|nr:hypothetical protein BMS3Abin13_00279 [bacterium BMS3Abin13]